MASFTREMTSNDIGPGFARGAKSMPSMRQNIGAKLALRRPSHNTLQQGSVFRLVR